MTGIVKCLDFTLAQSSDNVQANRRCITNDHLLSFHVCVFCLVIYFLQNPREDAGQKQQPKQRTFDVWPYFNFKHLVVQSLLDLGKSAQLCSDQQFVVLTEFASSPQTSQLPPSRCVLVARWRCSFGSLWVLFAWRHFLSWFPVGNGDDSVHLFSWLFTFWADLTCRWLIIVAYTCSHSVTSCHHWALVGFFKCVRFVSCYVCIMSIISVLVIV